MVRICPRIAPSRYRRWISVYPFETSLVVVTATQVLALLTAYTAGYPIGNHYVPDGVTLILAAMFAASAAFLIAALAVGTAGIMAAACRATIVAFLTVAGMAIPSGVTGPEAVMLAQIFPYVILTALRACYLESVWRADRGVVS